MVSVFCDLKYPLLQVNVELLPAVQLAFAGHGVQPPVPVLFAVP
jgi:hypothetical protein